MPRRTPKNSKRVTEKSKATNQSAVGQSAATERAAGKRRTASSPAKTTPGVQRSVTRALAKEQGLVIPSVYGTAPPKVSANKTKEEKSKRQASKTRASGEQTQGKAKTAVKSSQPIPEIQSGGQRGSDFHHPVATWAAAVEPDTVEIPHRRLESASLSKQLGYDDPSSSSISDSSAMTDASAVPSGSRESSNTRERSEKTDKTEKGLKPIQVNNKNFHYALMFHNISTSPQKIPDVLKSRMLRLMCREPPDNAGPVMDDSVRAIEKRWENDMSKCLVSNEAIFQRTIMMEILKRDELDAKLDFMCEAVWKSDRMPCRDGTRTLAQPKPDLCVGLKTDLLWPEDTFIPELVDLKTLGNHICAEGMKKGEIDRAFHFFSMEVKGQRGQIGNLDAEYQNLNTASQGLYNIYQVMKAVQMEEEYFEKVRFFSVVATTSTFNIRIHRPMKLRKDRYLRPDCGIGFGFDETYALSSGYDRKSATALVYNILVHYGVEILHPLLKKTMENVLKLEIPPSSKRSADGDLSMSFGSNSSQRRRTH